MLCISDFCVLILLCFVGKGEERAVAVCGKCSISASSSGMIEMALVWDMPQIVFKSKGVTHTR